MEMKINSTYAWARALDNWVKEQESKGGLFAFALKLSETPAITASSEADPSLIAPPTFSTWMNECGSHLYNCIQETPMMSAANPCFNAFTHCTGTNQITDTSFILEKTRTGMTTSINITKSAIKTIALEFFKLCNLPSLPPNTVNFCLNTDYTAIGVTASILLLQPFITNIYYREKTQISGSINRGILAGTIMSWAFDQNLYLGATTGAISALIIDPLLSYTLKPAFRFFETQYQKDYIKGTVEDSLKTMKYFAFLPVIAVCYSKIGNLIPFLKDTPYSILEIPSSIALASGTVIYFLKYPINKMQHILNQTTDLIGTLSSAPQIPLIAYTSLFLTLSTQSILDFSYQNIENLYKFDGTAFSYANCLTLCNQASIRLLQTWNNINNLAPPSKHTLAIYTLSTLAVLGFGTFSYQFFTKPIPPTPPVSSMQQLSENSQPPATILNEESDPELTDWFYGGS